MDLRDRFCVNVGMRRCCQPSDRVAGGHGFESRLGLIFGWIKEAGVGGWLEWTTPSGECSNKMSMNMKSDVIEV